MSTQPIESPLEEKHLDVHVEDTAPEKGRLDDANAEQLVKSRYDQLTVFQALWKFRVAAFYSFLVFTGYAIDGFEVS